MRFEGLKGPSKILEEQKPEKKDSSLISKDNKPTNPGRRDFIKKLAVIGGAAFTAGTVVGSLFDDEEESVDYKEKISVKEVEEPTKEQKEIKEDEIQTIKEVLDYNQEGKIEFNLDTVEKLKNNWKKKYKENPKFKNSLKKAYFEMGEWKEHLVEAFEKEGIEKKDAERLIYLAIPESHWDTKAVSKKRAVGPYQFLRKSAEDFELKTGYGPGEDSNYDGRKDPIDSAGACARHLLDVYNRADNDWDIALAGYNGNFANKYIGQVDYNNKKRVEDWIRGIKINNKNDAIKDNEVYHVIEEGQTLEKIASKYLTNIRAIQKANNISNPRALSIGQKLFIPIPDKEDRLREKKTFEGFVEFTEKTINKTRDAIKNNEFYHIVKDKETLGKISKKYLTSVSAIQKENNISDPRTIGIGQKLFIPIPDEKKEEVFNKLMEGYAENMVYPGKFKAVMELIDEKFVTKEKKGLDLVIKTINRGEEIKYKVKSGDNYYNLARLNKTSVEDIKNRNNSKNNTIRPGQVLKIFKSDEKYSLKDYATKEKISLSELEKLNPGIISSDKPMPNNYKLKTNKRA